MFPPYVANLWHSDEMMLYQIRESGGMPPAVKDLIIANTINSLIVYNVCHLYIHREVLKSRAAYFSCHTNILFSLLLPLCSLNHFVFQDQ